MGDNLFESAKILELQEHITELRAVWYKAVPYGTTPTDEQLDEFFLGGGDDTEGVAGSRGNRFAKWFTGRINASLTGTNGFAVGNRLSLADVLLYNVFAEVLTQDENSGDIIQREPFFSLKRCTDLVDANPKIKVHNTSYALEVIP